MTDHWKSGEARLAGKRLLILDGTRIACEIVRHAQRLGVHAIVADYNDPADAPAKQIADEHHRVSIIDVEAVVALIEREAIDGVVAGFSDRMLPYYAEICARADKPCYGSEELFRLFTDKNRYKALCDAYEVPTVRGYGEDDIQRDDGSVRYPVIVKPAAGSGSKGVTVCTDQEAVMAALERDRASTGVSDVVIEQFLDGDEATAFWIFQDGVIQLSMLANRYVDRVVVGKAPLPYAYTAPSSLVNRYLAEIAPQVERMLQSAGVRNGMMFMQGLIDDGTFRTYDIGFRLTGTQEYRLLEAVCGYNPLDMLINFALTGEMTNASGLVTADPKATPYSFNISVSMSPGTIGRLDGIEEVRSLPGVISAIATRDAGDELPESAAGELRQITVRILGTADSKDQLAQRINRVSRVVRILDLEEQDLALTIPELTDLEARVV